MMSQRATATRMVCCSLPKLQSHADDCRYLHSGLGCGEGGWSQGRRDHRIYLSRRNEGPACFNANGLGFGMND